MSEESWSPQGYSNPFSPALVRVTIFRNTEETITAAIRDLSSSPTESKV